MGELQSFHFEYQVEKPADSEPAQGTEVVAMTGEVSKEGYMRATIDVLQEACPCKSSSSRPEKPTTSRTPLPESGRAYRLPTARSANSTWAGVQLPYWSESAILST